MRRVDFRALNKALDFRDVARVLGIDLKGNKALCPFHNERTPSFVFYPDHWHCFGCGESGDYITLTAKMLCMSNYEAYKWLNDALSMGFSPADNARAKRSFRKDETINFNAWFTSAKFNLSDYIRIMGSIEDEDYRRLSDIVGAELLQDKLFDCNDAKEAFEKYESEVLKYGKRLELWRQRKTIQRVFDRK